MKLVLATWLAVCLLGLGAAAAAGDVRLRAAGPMGAGYVGMYYGLTDPTTGAWYVGQGWLGDPSYATIAIVDTGSSSTIIGDSMQQAYVDYDGFGLPMQSGVTFNDVGFGGSEVFNVTGPLRLVIPDFKTANASSNPEEASLYQPYAPSNSNWPAQGTLAAAINPIGGGEIDFDIIGANILDNRLLHVDPHYFEFINWMLPGAAGSFERPAPPPGDRRALYVPGALSPGFTTPQPVDTGNHLMLPIHIRRDASNAWATQNALFDTGSPVNFVSESFATAAGIDINSEPELTIDVNGVGGAPVTRPGWMLDSLAMDLGGSRAGSKLTIANTAVFVIPDSLMPAGLNAILGNGVLSAGMDPADPFASGESPLEMWYVDMRHGSPRLILMMPSVPGDANGDGKVDGADYTLMIDHMGQSGMLWEGDFNGNGVIDQEDGEYLPSDLTLWNAFYGRLAGDANHDGKADGADYSIWADNYGQEGGWEQGDFNGDGQVDDRDAMILQFGMGAGLAGGQVPEPSCLLMLLAGASLCRRRLA